MNKLLSLALSLSLCSPAAARVRTAPLGTAPAAPGFALPQLQLSAAQLASPILLLPVGAAAPLTPLPLETATALMTQTALLAAPVAAEPSAAILTPTYITTSNETTAASAPNKKAEKPKRGLLAGLAKALGLGRAPEVYDGGARLGILPENWTSPPGMDALPAPAPGGSQWRRRGRQAVLAAPEAAAPLDAAGVEAMLREHVRSRPAEFNGLSPDSLLTLSVRRIEGREGLADAFYAVFQQAQDGVPVEGAYLNFTVQVFDGLPAVTAAEARLFPSLSVNTAGGLAADELSRLAALRLGVPESDLRDLDRAIMHLGGRWRTVRLFASDSRGLVAAVDVSDGMNYAWDARMPIAEAARGARGRGVRFDPGATGENLEALPLGHIQVQDSAGRTYFADADGRFRVQGEGEAPVRLTVRLTGRYAAVVDNDQRDLVVTVEAKPGEDIQVLFNPTAALEGPTAQVNAYHHVTQTHEFLKSRGVAHEAIETAIKTNVNLDDECNAYFTPWNPSLNFFKASGKCVNTAYDTVVSHEYGHWWHMTAVKRVVTAFFSRNGLSEGWGDILSMFMTGQPVLGESFFKEGSREYIRHGENQYQYREGDEVHQEGQAWMGFAWKLRKALIARLGEREGAALVEALVLPVVFAMPTTVPAAIEAVLLRDTGKDGLAPHLAEIRAAAQAHGVRVRDPRRADGPLALGEPWWARVWRSALSLSWWPFR